MVGFKGSTAMKDAFQRNLAYATVVEGTLLVEWRRGDGKWRCRLKAVPKKRIAAEDYRANRDNFQD